MASETSVDALVEANRAIRKLSSAEVASLWSTLDLEDVEATKVALLRVMPSVVFKYGDMAAAIAADLYDEWRSGVREAARYRALMADIAATEKIQASTRYAIDGLYRDPIDAASVLALLQNDVADRYAIDQGRRTIAENIQRDPAKPRWGRIPVGETCTWCLMLGSRGFKPGLGYRSEMTAAAGSHGNCDCILAPDFATGDLIESYDPDAVYQQWKTAQQAEKADQSSR